MAESQDVYIYQPHPESLYWKTDLSRYAGTRLEEIAVRIGPEQQTAQKRNSTPERELYSRLVDLMSEEISAWDNSLARDYTQVVNAFGILTFSHLKRQEQLIFINMLNGRRKVWTEEGVNHNGIALTPSQRDLLELIVKRIEFPYNRNQLYFPFAVVDKATPTRITEIEDPEVTRIFSEETDDKIGYILRCIGSLNYRQQVKLLLGLSKEEFEEFRRRRSEGFHRLARDIAESNDLIPDRVERAKVRSRLLVGNPRYEVAAEIRRMYLDQGIEYPSTWDDEFTEKRI